MDSLAFADYTFQGTSQPLNCPVGRLIPAWSTSSIDRCPHHHDNEDSTYSSFSGGSSAPECELLYLPERIHEPLCSKAADDPRVVHCSNSRGVVHWYRSAERGSEHGPCALSHQPSWDPSPYPPAHLDSSLTRRNLSLEDHLERSQVTLNTACADHTDHTPQPSLRNFSNCNSVSTELQCRSCSHRTSGVISGNVQQRGQYIFVTGACKTPDTVLKDGRMGGMDSGSEVNGLIDVHGACSVTADPNSVPHWCHQDARLQNQCSKGRKDDESFYEAPCISNQASHITRGTQHSSDVWLKGNRLSCFRHQNSFHNILHASPENGSLPLNSGVKHGTSSLQNLDPSDTCRTVEKVQTQNAVGDSVNKAVAPVHHLTGECRVSLTRTSASQGEASVTLEELRQGCTSQGQQGNAASGPSSACAEGIASSGIYLNKIPLRDTQDVERTPTSAATLSLQCLPTELFSKDVQPVVQKESLQSQDVSIPLKILQNPEQMPFTLSRDVPPYNSSGAPECLDPGVQGKENSVQLQMARIGGRKRLTPEQKKMCYSDPEKLSHVEDTTAYRLLRSSDSPDGDPLCKQGLIVAQRKEFETKGHAVSTSCLSKSTLKLIQHKALQAYIQRKVVQSRTEPQQDFTRNPGSRHSVGGKISDCSLRTLCRTAEPWKSGGLLDISVSCDDCAGFISPPSREEGLSKEMSSLAMEKLASEDECLKQRKHSDSCRSYCPPSPHPCHTTNCTNDPLPVGHQTYSTQRRAEGVSLLRDRRLDVLLQSHRIWASAPSRMSKDEPQQWHGAAKLLGPTSRPELGERPCPRCAAHKTISSSWAGGESRQRPVRRRPFFKQESAPQLHISEAGSCEQACTRAQAVPCVLPPCPLARTQRYSSTPSLLSCSQASQRRGPGGVKFAFASVPMKNRSAFRAKASPVHPSLPELSVHDPEEIFDSLQEVFLSQELTMEPGSLPATPEGTWKKNDACLLQQGDDCPQMTPYLPEEPLGTSTMSCSIQEAIQRTASTGRQEQEEEGVSVDEPELTASSVTKAKTKSQWEVLVDDVVVQDQSLACVLLPAAGLNTVITMMEQMFSEDSLLMEEHYRRKQTEATDMPVTVDGPVLLDGLEMVTSPCATYSTPEDPTQGPGQATGHDVTRKKKLLVSCLEQRLRALEQQRAVLSREALANGEQAEAVAALVRETCPPLEHERYSQFMGDLERVVSLLLCLSTRLARVQNALATVDLHMDAEEKESLDNRRRLLCKQRDDAKELKANLDRRERLLFRVLARHLSAEELDDYKTVVKTKATLLMLQKDLDEKQRLWEGQLQALLTSITPSPQQWAC